MILLSTLLLSNKVLYFYIKIMERRREILGNELDDGLNHFKGKTDVNPLRFLLNNESYSIETDDNGEFDFIYDFELTSLYQACLYLRNNCNMLQITELNTSKVTTMKNMFNQCLALTSLDVTSFNTSNVTDMSAMFNDCRKLTFLDVSHFDTSKVTNMSAMFYDCRKLTSLDVSNFDTSKVTNMSDMFHNCYNITYLDLSNFDTSKVTSMSDMFYSCGKLIFLDLSNFNVSKVTYKTSMFNYCNELTHIKTNSAFRDWCITNATSINLPTNFKDINYSGWEIID